VNPVFFNFDGATVGALPSGFVAISAAPIVVTTAGAITGANALGENSPSGGDDVCLFPTTSSPNQAFQCDFVAVGASDSSSNYTVPGIVLRSDSTYSNAYLIVFDNTGSASWVKRVAGTYGGVSTGSAGITLTSGQRYSARAEANGTTLNFYLWPYGTSQPGSPNFTATDSSVTTGNYCGLRFGGIGSTVAISADDVYIGDPGVSFAGGFIAPTLSNAGNTTTTATLSWTAASQSATGSPTYQLQQSPHSANTWSNVSGATTSPGTATGLSISTTYDFRVVASDGVNSPVDSNTISVTTGSNTLSISPTSLSASKLQYPVQLTPSGYSYGGVAPTVTLTGGTGSSVSYVTNSGLAIICPGTASGSITVSDGTASTTLTVNASTAVSIAPNNSSLAYYGAWNVQSTDATTINSGGTIEFGWEGADTCKFGLDLTGLAYPPELVFELDGVPLTRWTTAEILANPTFNLAPTYTSTTSPASFAHRVKVWVAGVYEGADAGGTQASVNQWTEQQAACKVLGVELPSGGTLLATPVDPNQIEFLGDSITASVRALYTGSGASNQTVMASHIAWPQIAADLLGLKPVVRGFGGTGITVSGSGGAPALGSSFPYVYSGVTYAPANQPSVVVLYEGTNDVSGITQAQWQVIFTQVRTARPSAMIFAIEPYQESTNDSNLSAAVTAQADSKLFYLNYNSGVYGSSDVATDGKHPNPGGHSKLGSRLASDIQVQLTASGYKLQGSGVYPTAPQVLTGVTFGPTDNLTGTVVLPTAAQVEAGVNFGPGSDTAGTYEPGGLLTLAQLDDALAPISAAITALSGPTGTIVSGSTTSTVIVSGLPPNLAYTGQHLYNFSTAESRTVGGAQFDQTTGNYSFLFSGPTGTQLAPFGVVTTGNSVTVTP
jgi:lysophospholipase L1-like esterase